MDAPLPEEEQRYLALMDEASEFRRNLQDNVEQHDEAIESLEQRVSALEARLVTEDVLTPQQARQVQRMVSIITDILEKKDTGTYQTVYGAIKEQFNVPSYKMVPEEEFPRLQKFLAQWYKRLTPTGTMLPDVFTQPGQGRLF